MHKSYCTVPKQGIQADKCLKTAPKNPLQQTRAGLKSLKDNAFGSLFALCIAHLIPLFHIALAPRALPRAVARCCDTDEPMVLLMSRHSCPQMPPSASPCIRVLARNICRARQETDGAAWQSSQPARPKEMKEAKEKTTRYSQGHTIINRHYF